MQYYNFSENKQRGTFDFPFEIYNVTADHPRYVMAYHWHVEYEIIRILEGSLHVTMDEKDFTANAGDIVFVNSGILHSGVPSDCVYQCIVFDLNAFLKHNSRCQTYIQKIIDHSAFVYHHFTPKYQLIHQIIWNIFDAMEGKKTGYELIVYGELYHFFGIVFGEGLYFSDAPQNRRDYKKIMQLKKVLDFMEENYSSPLTLEQLSASVNMSPKYFCRFFSSMTHRTPIDYLNYHRIEHASYQLATTDISVTEAAYNCGFNDLSYFIKTYKKYKGITPGKTKN
ncbi:MAG: AraC family transcriptional regulator [Clostridia bacterium]|nr:AraC family transcriptional regulator [Clostridia bacterium]NCC42298.1 AraC family transcriptional regulator [Clostridia bacterium]